MKRIAVLVSGGGTNLQALIDAQGRGEIINGSIAAVVSSSSSFYASFPSPSLTFAPLFFRSAFRIAASRG